jgi:hypothetical protein
MAVDDRRRTSPDTACDTSTRDIAPNTNTERQRDVTA